MRVCIDIDSIMPKNNILDDEKIDLIRKLSKAGHEIYILNDRNEVFISSFREYLNKKFDGQVEVMLNKIEQDLFNSYKKIQNVVECDDVIFSPPNSKGEACLANNIDVMISDSPNLLTEVDLSGIKTILLDSEKNRGKVNNIIRLSSNAEIVDFLKKYGEEKRFDRPNDYLFCNIYAANDGEEITIDDWYDEKGKPCIPWNKIHDTGQPIVVRDLGLRKPIINRIRNMFVTKLISNLVLDNFGLVLKVPCFPACAKEHITGLYFDTVYIGKDEVRMSNKDLQCFVITSDRKKTLPISCVRKYEKSNTYFSFREVLSPFTRKDGRNKGDEGPKKTLVS